MKGKTVQQDFKAAKETYAGYGVDAEKALESLGKMSLSLHCWQGDDVAGFERSGAALSGGGIQVTGSHPGRARTIDELRADLEKAFSLIPGRHRLNLHAIYGEFGKRRVDRDHIGPAHFKGWMEWCRERGLKLDFNATCFSHPLAASGFTLGHADKKVRRFWIEHVSRCREIAAFMGQALKSPCVHNLWIPDGSKEIPADRASPRGRLKESLDKIYSKEYDASHLLDAVESKLFGIGSESYVAGSHEFYMGYAQKRGLLLCLDTGHFHPTESVADKVSAVLQFSKGLLLHVSRGVRWDSDHVAVLDDGLRDLCREIVRSGRMADIRLALDYFDASMNRVGAWVIGARALLKGLLLALLEPADRLRRLEKKGDAFSRLALQEEAAGLPFGAVWNYHCHSNDMPWGSAWMHELDEYEKNVLLKRA